MRHSKSRFIESRSEDPDISGDARRVGTGAVRNRPYRVGLNTVRLETAPTGERGLPFNPTYKIAL